MLFRSRASTPVAVPNAGIWMVWGDVATINKPFVKGGQVVIEWTDLRQAGDSAYHWDANSFKWTGFGDISSFGGKPFTVQVNSNFKLPCNHGAAGCTTAMNPNVSTAANPDNRAKKWFGYEPDIAWCGKFDPGADSSTGGAYRFDVPQFWNSSKTGLNTTYMGYLDQMVANLRAHLTATGFPKERILGVRTAPNIIGTEHVNFKDEKIRPEDIPATPACNRDSLTASQWSALGDSAYNAAMAQYKAHFYETNTGIKPIFRGQKLEDVGAIPASKLLVFNTNASPDDKKQMSSSDLYYTKVRRSTYQSYYEPFQKSEVYNSPVTWNYWLILEQLHRGVNYIAVYGDDLKKAGNDACPPNTASILGTTGNQAVEYRMAYCFANKYAPFANNQLNPAKAQASPGAWIAFTRNELSPNNSAYIGMYLDGNNIAGSSTPANIAFVETEVGVKTPIAAQGGSMGNPAQRYGRFARSITPAQSLGMSLNPNFKGSLGSNIKVNVTYLDTGAGSVSLKWGTASDKIATFSKGTTPNNWVTRTVTIPVSALPTSGNHLTLTTAGSNTTFHMVEVLR